MRPLFLIAIIFSLFTCTSGFAQSAPVKQSFKVSGECSQCKKKIESSALKAGAAAATWNVKTKVMNVSFAPGETNLEQIQQAIAAAGYDTPNYKADSSAYNTLDECCKYERIKTSTSRKQ